MLLSCDEAGPYLVHAADNPMPIDGTGPLPQHLVACWRCRQELEDQRAVVALLRTRPPDQPSPNFSAGLAAKLEAVGDWFGIADWKRWTLRLWPAAAILVLAAFCWPSSRHRPAAESLNQVLIASEPSSPEAILWQFGTSPDAVVETMLVGRQKRSTVE